MRKGQRKSGGGESEPMGWPSTEDVEATTEARMASKLVDGPEGTRERALRDLEREEEACGGDDV